MIASQVQDVGGFRAVRYTGPEINWRLAWAVRACAVPGEPLARHDTGQVMVWESLQSMAQWAQHEGVRFLKVPALGVTKGQS